MERHSNVDDTRMTIARISCTWTLGGQPMRGLQNDYYYLWCSPLLFSVQRHGASPLLTSRRLLLARRKHQVDELLTATLNDLCYSRRDVISRDMP